MGRQAGKLVRLELQGPMIPAPPATAVVDPEGVARLSGASTRRIGMDAPGATMPMYALATWEAWRDVLLSRGDVVSITTADGYVLWPSSKAEGTGSAKAKPTKRARKPASTKGRKRG